MAQGIVNLEFVQRLMEEAGRQRPPVTTWNPPDCGPIDIRIDGEGRWFHEGGEIRRPSLVRLLSSVLRREADGSYWLCTPVEKFSIGVDDVPFIGVDHEIRDDGGIRQILITTNCGDHVLLDADHPLMTRPRPTGDVAPYVEVRDGLEARIGRSLFYRLVELAAIEPVPDSPADARAMLSSCGARFELGRFSAG